MGIENIIQTICEAIYPHPSLLELKNKFKKEFNLHEANILVMRDNLNSKKTGYIEFPKKENISEKRIERIVTKFYLKYGFNSKTYFGKNSFCLWNGGGQEKYQIKILGENENYFLDIDRVKLIE